jgi:hypothetical protein
MTESRQETPQWADLIVLVQRTARYLPILAVVSIVVSLFAAGYLRSAFQPRYTSEAIALVRPPVTFSLTAPQITTPPSPADDSRRGQPEFLPQPLNAFDYRILLESDAVFERAAALYNERYTPYTPMTAASFRGRCQALERLEVRTPHAAKYHPTLSLRATAGDPEQALRMAQCWADAAERWAHGYEESIRHRQLAALEQVRMHLMAEQARYTEPAPAPGPGMAVIEHALLQAQVAAARGVYEFEIVAEPILPGPQRARSVAQPALLVGLIAFAGLWALVIIAALFAQAARAVR